MGTDPDVRPVGAHLALCEFKEYALVDRCVKHRSISSYIVGMGNIKHVTPLYICPAPALDAVK